MESRSIFSQFVIFAILITNTFAQYRWYDDYRYSNDDNDDGQYYRQRHLLNILAAQQRLQDLTNPLCLNGGTRTPGTTICTCAPGWQGTRCETRRTQCPVYLSFDANLNAVNGNGAAIATATTGTVAVDATATRMAHGAGSMTITAPGFVRIPSSAISLTNQMSICLFERLLGGVIVTNDDNSLAITINAALPATTAPNTNVQVCVVYDGKTITYYQNGALWTSVPSTSSLPAFTYIAVGSQATSGNMDEVLICDRAITAAEVTAHFNGPATMRTAGLIN